MTGSNQAILQAFIVLGLVSAALADCGAQAPPSRTARLRRHLFCDYDKSVRPVKHHDTTTQVEMGLMVNYIDFYDFGGVLEVDGVMVLAWKDEHLTWNPEDYDQIRFLVLKTNSFWTPEISHLNAADFALQGALQFKRCILFFNGGFSCFHHNNFLALCDSDFRRWPYDTKNCSLEFGPIKHTQREIEIEYSHVDLYSTPNFNDMGEWQLVDMTSNSVTSRYTCCENGTYSVAVTSIHIQRNHAKHLGVITAPIVVFAMMTLCTFCISSLKSDRMVLCCWNLLSHLLYMHYLLAIVFGNHAFSTPYVVLYFRDSLVMAASSLVFTIIGRIYARKNTAPHSLLVRAATSTTRLMKVREIIPFSFKITHSRLLTNSAEGSSENVHDTSMLVCDPVAREEVSRKLIVDLMDIVLFVIYLLLYFVFILDILT